MTDAPSAPLDPPVTPSPEPAADARLDAVAEREFPRVRREGVAYLNSASTGPLPEAALRVLRDWDARRAEPWRISQAEQFGTLARARAGVAALIGATPGEVALMPNTSYGLNLAMRGLPLGPGDVVVTSDREFPSNVYPWLTLARARGTELVRVPCRGRVADEAALLAALDRPRVKVLVVSWVSFETGVALDLAALGAACRARGIYFVVDAIQGVGALPLDVSRLPVDLLACGCQKWLLSPWGTGFVYVRRDLIPQLDPVDVGWSAVRGSDDFTRLLDYDLTFHEDARRYEVITLAFQEFAAACEALALFHEVGPGVAAARIRRLGDRIVAWAQGRDDMTLLSDPAPSRRSGIVSLVPPDAARASAALADAGVWHSVREGAIRLSPHWFTPADHVERALDVLARAAR